MKTQEEINYLKTKHMKGNKYRQTHGRTNTPEFYIWRSMKARCYNPNSQSYKRYGARGIEVCEEWINSFETFFNDMGERPKPTFQLDRIDNEGDYFPSNCRWVSAIENGSNRENNVKLTLNNETLTEAQWCRKLGIKTGGVTKRLLKGWPLDKALQIPKLPRHKRQLPHSKSCINDASS